MISYYQDLSNIPADILQKAQDKGSAVHDVLSGQIPINFIPEEWHPYVAAAASFVTDHKVSPLITERRYYDHALLLTGKIDLIAHTADQCILVDWKTSRSPSPWWEMQLQAYIKLIHDYSIDSAIIVHLKQDGSYSTYSYQPNEQIWNEFLLRLDHYRTVKDAQND